MSSVGAPLGMLAELTHRCPLACPYCSNPLELESRKTELDTDTWRRVMREAGEMGVLQVHLSGGEPASRRDLEEITKAARDAGLYTNLITSAVGVPPARIAALADAGMDHVQISIQDSVPEGADRVAGYDGAYRQKIALAHEVTRLGMRLTVNAVMHKHNIGRVAEMVALAVSLGAQRVEIAHVQYYGWALKNRAALMPSRADAEVAVAKIEQLRRDYQGRIVIDAVTPDYYARLPKACMGGWGRRSLNVTPSGRVLPCHAAESLAGTRILVGARSWAGRHLGALARVHGVSRHGLDEGAVLELHPSRKGFRRLPLPGLCDDRRCARSRSGVSPVAASPDRRRAGGSGRRAGVRLSRALRGAKRPSLSAAANR